jgi:3-oxoacyl-[acyl-carrier protein] reductase
MKLNGKIAIITGAGSGMGCAAALLFAREGAKVVVADVHDGNGQETVEKIHKAGGEAIFVHTDVTKSTDVERVVRRTVDTFGRIDILYNNVGIPQRPKLAELIEEDEWNNLYAVNVKGTFLMTKYAIPEMKKAKCGVIINTGSIAGVRVRPLGAAYTSSKAAVIAFTKALAIELARDNIRVNCINPVATDTPFIPLCMREDATEEDARKWKESIVRSIPLGRMAKPEEIAFGALYLASDDAAMVTGAELNIDGGRGI